MTSKSRSLPTLRAWVTGAAALVSVAAHAQLYFNDLFYPDFNFGSIKRVNANGGGLAQLVDAGGGIRGLAVDVAGGKLYWADVIELFIKRSDLDGSNVENIVQLPGGEDPAFPSALAIHKPSGKLYWGDQLLGTMNRANLDGSSAEILFSTPFHRGLVIDDVNGLVYWNTSISDVKGEIWRCNLDGSNRVVVVSSLEQRFKPNKLALDLEHGKIYWTDYVVDVVQRSNLNGSNIETLYVPPFNRNPGGIALDVPNGVMYWGQDIEIDGNTGKIMNAALDGSGAQDFLFGFGHVTECVFIGDGASTETLVPVSEQLLLGRFDGGSLISWRSEDGNLRRLRKFFVPNIVSPFVRCNLHFKTTKTAPTNIQLRVKPTWHSPGPLQISLWVEDKQGSQYVVTDVDRQNLVNGTTFVGTPPQPLGRYVASDGTVSGRIEIWQAGPTTEFYPFVDFDLGNLVVRG